MSQSSSIRRWLWEKTKPNAYTWRGMKMYRVVIVMVWNACVMKWLCDEMLDGWNACGMKCLWDEILVSDESLMGSKCKGVEIRRVEVLLVEKIWN